jgi:hypothetical protein
MAVRSFGEIAASASAEGDAKSPAPCREVAPRPPLPLGSEIAEPWQADRWRGDLTSTASDVAALKQPLKKKKTKMIQRPCN